MSSNSLHIVIMCGGVGSRLWPMSRDLLPKQFLNLTDKNKSMFQITCENALELGADKLIIVCSDNHQFLVNEQLQKLNISNFQIVSEPFRRDTAAAIAVSSQLIDANSNVFVLTADHIWNIESLKKSLNKGLILMDESDTDDIVFIGIKPTYPETGYGYIQKYGNKLSRFVEKPDLNNAKKYFESPQFLWNSGIFLFKNNTMQNAFHTFQPNIWRTVRNTLENSGDLNEKVIKLNADFFDKVEEISIDYAIMEKVHDGLVVSYSDYWCDVGSFEALYNHSEKDENKNVLNGDINTIGTHECFVNSENRLVTLIDCDNLVVSDERDALLICNKKSSQKVKDLGKLLKKEKREELKYHNKVFRPWGWYINVEGSDTNGFKVKRIGVYPGKRLSLQSHNKRSEHWVIVRGKARVQVGQDFLNLEPNQHVYIPKETLHRMENLGDEMVEFVETQIGEYLGEDDIVRYQDDFGRV